MNNAANTFVIVNVATGKQYGGLYAKSYETMRGAKSSITRLVNKGKAKADALMACSLEDFIKNDPMVTVQNLMSGKDVQIRRSEVGGCCDPSTETYWSM